MGRRRWGVEEERKHTEILERLIVLFIPVLVISHNLVVSLDNFFSFHLFSISPAASPLSHSITFSFTLLSLFDLFCTHATAIFLGARVFSDFYFCFWSVLFPHRYVLAQTVSHWSEKSQDFFCCPTLDVLCHTHARLHTHLTNLVNNFLPHLFFPIYIFSQEKPCLRRVIS